MLKSTQKIYPVHNLPPSSNLDFRIEEIEFNNHYNTNHPHAHDYFEIFLFSNKGGEHIVDFTSHPIEANSIHLVLPGQVHQVNREGSCTGIVMMFSKEYASSNPSLLQTLNETPFIFTQNHPYIEVLKKSDFDWFFDLVSKVYKDNSSNGFNSKPIIQSYLNILLLKTQEIFSTSKYSISKTTPSNHQ